MEHLTMIFVFLAGVASVFIVQRVRVWYAWRKFQKDNERRELEHARRANERELFRSGPDTFFILIAAVVVAAIIRRNAQ